MLRYSPLLEKAIRRAASAHRHQTRKASDLPYITHPFAVMYLLAQSGCEDEELLAAALLHDAVEDTPVTLEELQQEFPQQVCGWMAVLSEKKKDDGGQARPWEDRKQDHIAQIRNASSGACAILLADKLHNLHSILFDLEREGRTVWARFNAPPERIFWYHQQMFQAAPRDSELHRILHAACEETLTKLEPYLSAADR